MMFLYGVLVITLQRVSVSSKVRDRIIILPLIDAVMSDDLSISLSSIYDLDNDVV